MKRNLYSEEHEIFRDGFRRFAEKEIVPRIDGWNAAGITDTFDLGKLISGFTANMNYYGSVTYTMRGIGFQDTALASPQSPLPSCRVRC